MAEWGASNVFEPSKDEGVKPLSAIPGAAPEAISTAWPIGSVFIAVVSTNPGTLLGIGTWTAIGAGRVLVGINGADTDFDTAEETGGAKTSTPNAHSGTAVDAHAGVTVDSHTGCAVADHTKVATKQGTGAGDVVTTETHSVTQAADHTVTQPNNHTVTQPAAHAAMSIVQPYLVVYMWKRTA